MRGRIFAPFAAPGFAFAPHILSVPADTVVLPADGVLLGAYLFSSEDLNGPTASHTKTALDIIAAWNYRIRQFKVTATISWEKDYIADPYSVGDGVPAGDVGIQPSYSESGNATFSTTIDRSVFAGPGMGTGEFFYDRFVAGNDESGTIISGSGTLDRANGDPTQSLPLVIDEGVADATIGYPYIYDNAFIGTKFAGRLTAEVSADTSGLTGCGMDTPRTNWAPGIVTPPPFHTASSPIASSLIRWNIRGDGVATVTFDQQFTAYVESSLAYSSDSGTSWSMLLSSYSFALNIEIEALEYFVYGVNPDSPFSETTDNPLWNSDGTRLYTVDEIMRANLLTP